MRAGTGRHYADRPRSPIGQSASAGNPVYRSCKCSEIVRSVRYREDHEEQLRKAA